MKRINIYLALGLALLFSVSCASTKEAGKDKKKDKKAVLDKKGKERTFLRVHLQENPDGTDRNTTITVYRANPVKINVHKVHFLDEANVEKAEVVDDVGGFAIKLQFDRRGSRELSNISNAYKGQQIAIVAWFGDGLDKLRWLAAPYMNRPIENGVLMFTPDATREEAERICLGINNTVKAIEKDSLIKTKD
jgi:hypothetical protein